MFVFYTFLYVCHINAFVHNVRKASCTYPFLSVILPV
jgi:hypothetical protein